MKASDPVDFLVISAHADDAELCCGGTIARMCKEGRRGVMVDLTAATAATRGTPEMRLQEAQEAAGILGVQERVNLGMTDAGLQMNQDAVFALVDVIRHYRPAILLTHWTDDRHPDHYITGELVKQAWYKAGLAALRPQVPAHRPGRLFHFFGPVLAEPSFCIDVSEYWETKMKAVLAFRSQFYQPGMQEEGTPENGPMTAIATPEFLQFVEARGRHFGTLIRTRYAEGFRCRETAEVQDLLSLSRSPF